MMCGQQWMLKDDKYGLGGGEVDLFEGKDKLIGQINTTAHYGHDFRDITQDGLLLHLKITQATRQTQ